MSGPGGPRSNHYSIWILAALAMRLQRSRSWTTKGAKSARPAGSDRAGKVGAALQLDAGALLGLQALDGVRRKHDLDFVVQAVEDGGIGAAGREQAEPDGGAEIGKAGFLGGRHVGQQRLAAAVGD